MMHGYCQEKINVGHYWDLQQNLLYLAVHFAHFGFLCSLNHLSGPLIKEIHIYFQIGGSPSVLFVSCSKACCFVIGPPVLGNNRLVKFASQSFMIFLILVTCKDKAMSASFLRQKIHSPQQFPSLFLSSQSHSQPSWANMLHCDLH